MAQTVKGKLGGSSAHKNTRSKGTLVACKTKQTNKQKIIPIAKTYC